MRRVSFIVAWRQHGLKLIEHSWIPALSTSLGTGFVVMTMLIVVGAYPTETFAAGPYKIDRYTIDSGGGTSAGGPYVLTGTIGQPDAGWSEGSKYELLGGFWSGGAVCKVNFGELAAFCDHWLETGSGIKADLDKNKKVDFVDYSILVNLWLGGCPYP